MNHTKAPKTRALQLADTIQQLSSLECVQQAAAELRRQHELIGLLVSALRVAISEAEHVGDEVWMTGVMHSDDYNAARAAIDAATGGAA